MKNKICFLSKVESKTLLSSRQKKIQCLHLLFPSFRILQNVTIKHREDKDTFFP